MRAGSHEQDDSLCISLRDVVSDWIRGRQSFSVARPEQDLLVLELVVYLLVVGQMADYGLCARAT